MQRRTFLGGSLSTLVAAGALPEPSRLLDSAGVAGPVSPGGTKLAVRPVMTNIIHSGAWEGSCRWQAVPPDKEKAVAESAFASWSRAVDRRFADDPHIELLAPVHITFAEDFRVTEAELAKLGRDGKQADALLISPRGDSQAAFTIGQHLGSPIVMEGLNCRTVDICAYSRSKGVEAYATGSEAELRQLFTLLRARKVFRQTRILFPTDRGLPPVASLASVNDLAALQRQHGISVVQITYQELADEMRRTLSDATAKERAETKARQLLAGAEHVYLKPEYVVRAMQFYETVWRLMGRHRCNAFTIECFEFCSSRLPEKWTVTPCLIHTLLKDQGFASSCEADLGALLSMRLLMSVAQKSSHLGNMFLRAGDVLAINHSAPGLKMNGFDQPGLPYKLGRFVSAGWGAKAVVDFMNNGDKDVTVVRINPQATGMLLLRGRLVGSAGWEGDNLGCSVEARIKPKEGRAVDFARKQADYGNHLIWVYGDYADQMKQLGQMLGMTVEVLG